MNQNKDSNEKRMPNKVAMYLLNLENALQYIEIENPYTNKICKLLVDSGAQLNIIKKCQVPANVSLEGKKIQLSGITDKAIQTLGMINMPINKLYIEFHVAPENFSLPYDGILGIKILTQHKLRLDEGYLQINNQKIKLKPRYGNTLNPNFNTITKQPREIEEKTRSKITTEQKGFLKEMLNNINGNKTFESKINEGKQQEIQTEKLMENMESSEEIQKASCSISYEPTLLNIGEVQVTSEITFYDDITKILNKISELKQDEKALQEKTLNDILTEEKAKIHYEEVLRNNQGNIKSLINNINIISDNKDEKIEFEEIGATDYKQFLTIINNRVEGNFEEYNKLYGNEKEYNFISYEIDNLPEGFQIIDDFNIDENEIYV